MNSIGDSIRYNFWNEIVGADERNCLVWGVETEEGFGDWVGI